MSGNSERDAEYRAYGVEWTIDEVPVKKTRPIGYVYICQRCGARFTQTRQIHIPWCDSCRLAELGRFRSE